MKDQDLLERTAHPTVLTNVVSGKHLFRFSEAFSDCAVRSTLDNLRQLSMLSENEEFFRYS